MFRFVCSFALAVSLTLVAVGDVPPPPPEKGFKRVPYENVLKLREDLPGYKFYTFERLGLNGQETIGDELKLTTKTGIAVPSTSSPSVRTGVVAVPISVMNDLKTKENLAKLLAEDNKDGLPDGVVIHETRGTIRDLKESDPRNKVENVITVSPDEQVGVKFTTEVSSAPPSEDATPGTSMGLGLGTLVAGIAAALAIVTLGIWYFRRK